jgi:hypothetical protein
MPLLTSWLKNNIKQSDFTPICRLPYFLTMKMEVKYSSEILVDFHWTTWRCIPEKIIFNEAAFVRGIYLNP